MSKKLFACVLSFVLCLSLVCPCKKIARADEYTLSEVLTALGFTWDSGLDYFVEGLVWDDDEDEYESYPYFMVLRTASSVSGSTINAYKYMVVRFYGKPATILFNSSQSRFYGTSGGEITLGNYLVISSTVSVSALNSGGSFSSNSTTNKLGINSNNYYTDVIYSNFDWTYRSNSIQVNNIGFSAATPTPTPTNTPSPTPTNTPSPTPTNTPSPVPTNTVTPSPVPTNTVTPSPVPTNTVTPSPVPTNSVTPSPVPTNTVTPSPVPTVSVVPTPGATGTPTPVPPPFYPGGSDGTGLSDAEAYILNYLQDLKDIEENNLFYLKNLCALVLVLVGFETLKIVRAWSKGVGLK